VHGPVWACAGLRVVWACAGLVMGDDGNGVGWAGHNLVWKLLGSSWPGLGMNFFRICWAWYWFAERGLG
jgi:hypothetical protein